MKALICDRCGSTEFTIKDGCFYCEYCGSRLVMTNEEMMVYKTSIEKSTNKFSQISINSDVENLLQKCRIDRKNARKYANLILDIDPDNEEARKYL